MSQSSHSSASCAALEPLLLPLLLACAHELAILPFFALALVFESSFLLAEEPEADEEAPAAELDGRAASAEPVCGRQSSRTPSLLLGGWPFFERAGKWSAGRARSGPCWITPLDPNLRLPAK